MRTIKIYFAICLFLLLNSMGALADQFTASHYSAVIQGSCIYAKSWDDAEGCTPMGIY